MEDTGEVRAPDLVYLAIFLVVMGGTYWIRVIEVVNVCACATNRLTPTRHTADTGLGVRMESLLESQIAWEDPSPVRGDLLQQKAARRLNFDVERTALRRILI